MSEWNTHKLGIIADVRDGTHDSPKQVTHGKPLVTSHHIKQGKIDLDNAYHISLDDFEAVNKRSKVDKYDILFSMIGTVGEMALIDFEPDFAIKNVGLFKTNGDIGLAKWILYYLKSKDAQAEIDACLKGSTQQYITLGDLRRFPIALPPLPEQKSIASVLSSLDDKIDLLHRQNKTLEAIAETLFKKMFQQPSPNLSQRERDKEVQEEWEEVKLDNMIDISSGKGLKKKEYVENGPYPVLGANGEIGRTDKFLFNEKLIFTGRVGTLGRIFISTGKAWLSDNTLIIKPKENLFYFVYFLLKDVELEGYNVGSTQPLVRQSDVKKIETLLPEKEQLYQFEAEADLIFNKIQHNQSQIRTLEKLRDTLLPKLMSGEVRVEYEN